MPSREETDRVIRADRIVSLADTVFGDHAKALRWLDTAGDRIDNRMLMSLLKTEAGCRLIESMLWQVDEGVYS